MIESSSMSNTNAMEKSETGVAAAPSIEQPTTVSNETAAKEEAPADNANQCSDDEDDEEAIFISIEKEKEEEEKKEESCPHDQPKEISAAPKLLRDALKKGEVKADQSEEENENKNEEESETVIKKEAEENKKQGGASPDRHVHARVRAAFLLFPVYF